MFLSVSRTYIALLALLGPAKGGQRLLQGAWAGHGVMARGRKSRWHVQRDCLLKAQLFLWRAWEDEETGPSERLSEWHPAHQEESQYVGGAGSCPLSGKGTPAGCCWPPSSRRNPLLMKQMFGEESNRPNFSKSFRTSKFLLHSLGRPRCTPASAMQI